MSGRRVGFAVAAALGAAALVAGGWWLAGAAGPAGHDGVRLHRELAWAPPGGRPAVAAAPSRAATGSGQAASSDPFLQASLRHRLEDLLLAAGGASTPEALKQQLAAVIGQHFRPEDATRALELAGRYVDYRVAVSKLQPPRDMGDPHALRTSLETRQRERRRHFSDEEWQALFGEEEELDRYTIARLEITRNASLTAQQKQDAMRSAEAELSDAQRAGRADALLHERVAAQTAALDAAGASEQQRYEQRRALHGEAAAVRLAQLDREEADWQGRLERYAQARTNGDAAAADALRQSLFSPEEQLRLEGALGLRQLRR